MKAPTMEPATRAPPRARRVRPAGVGRPVPSPFPYPAASCVRSERRVAPTPPPSYRAARTTPPPSAAHGLSAEHLWNRGEPPVPELPPLPHGGFTLRISDAPEAHEQIRDAAAFLRRSKRLMQAIRDARRVQGRWLEASYRVDPGEHPTTLCIPSALVQALAQLNIEIVATAVPRAVAVTG